MQLWLASYPRSGNTFLRILLRHRYAIRSVSMEFDRSGPVPRTFRKSRDPDARLRQRRTIPWFPM